MVDARVSKRLRDLRKAVSKTQDQVSEACGFSKIALTRYETGARMPKTEIAARLAEYYGVSVDYILGRDDPPPPPPADAVELQEKEAAMRKEILEIMQSMNDEQYEMALNVLKVMTGRK